MAILSSILFAMLAGFINGSYAFPVKYMNKWNTENIWLAFSILTFLIIPWFVVLFLIRHVIHVLTTIPIATLLILMVSGFIFGIGMILFTFSLKYVGLGTSFILNISIGTVCASLVPTLILDKVNIFSSFELLHIAAMLLFIIGVFTASRAVKLRDMHHSFKKNNKKSSYIGILLGVLSGFFTAFQGLSYAYTFPKFQAIGQQLGISRLGIDNLPWLAIFSTAFIPYAFYFFLKIMKNKSHINYIHHNIKRYWFFILIMGVFYFSSLLLYSHSATLIGIFGPALSWPIMMIFIILTSNFWGFIQGEWKCANVQAYLYLGISILLLISAICLLATDSYFSAS